MAGTRLFKQQFEAKFCPELLLRGRDLSSEGGQRFGESTRCDLSLPLEFTPLEINKPVQRRLLSLSIVELLTLQGKCSPFRAKAAKVSGKLPINPQYAITLQQTLTLT